MKLDFFKTTSLVLVAIAALSSCKKDDKMEDNEPPVIKINEPSKSEYFKGDTVWMDIEVTDNIEMHEVRWKLTKLPSEVVYENKRHQHASKIHVMDTYYIIPTNVEDDSEYKFEVEAEDDARNLSTADRSFLVR